MKMKSLAASLFLLAATPILKWYYERAIDGSDEPLGLIALAAACFFLFQQRKKLELSPLLLPASFLLVILQLLPGLPPLLIAASAITLLVFCIKIPAGKTGLAALLVLSLPLMASLDFYAGFPMRLAAAWISKQVLHLCQVPVERNGAILLDNHQIIGVDPPCSGLRMLWTCLFTASVMITRRQLNGSQALGLGFITVGAVILGNSLRAAILFFPESGRVHWPAWTHEGTGLVIHALALLVIIFSAGKFKRHHSKATQQAQENRIRQTPKSRYLKAAFTYLILLASVTALALKFHPSFSTKNRDADLLPLRTLFDGEPLTPLPLDEREHRFLSQFPGTISRFAASDKEIIFRQVNRPTRLLHPVAHCFRACGHHLKERPIYKDTDFRLWGQHHTTSGTPTRIREAIISSDGSKRYTDVSSWYWSALLSPEQGPWLAITIIEPIEPGILAANE